MIEIVNSDEYESNVVVVAELPKCFAFGTTEEYAFVEARTAIGLRLVTAGLKVCSIPEVADQLPARPQP